MKRFRKSVRDSGVGRSGSSRMVKVGKVGVVRWQLWELGLVGVQKVGSGSNRPSLREWEVSVWVLGCWGCATWE